MEVFHHVEVLLRNRIHNTLADRLDTAWIRDPEVLSAGSLLRVDDAVKRITRLGKEATAGQIVAHVSFGFWASLFARHYDESLWKPHLHLAFKPHGPALRKTVAARLMKLNTFRNRVAHHEPIYPYHPVARYGELIEFAGWIDPEARKWIRSVSRIAPLLKSRPTTDE